MSENRKAFLLVILLAASTGFISLLRHSHLKNRSDLRGESVWRVTYNVEIKRIPDGARLRIGIPDISENNRVFRETFSYSGLTMDILRSRRTGGREAVGVKRYVDGPFRFEAEFEILLNTGEFAGIEAVPTVLSTSDRSWFLSMEDVNKHERSLINNVLSSLAAAGKGKGGTADRIHEFCSDEIIRDEFVSYTDGFRSIRDLRGNTEGTVRGMVLLLRAAMIPSRIVAGFVLGKDHDGIPHMWVEAYLKKQWVPFDPVFGYVRILPAEYVPVIKDSSRIVRPLAGAEVMEQYQVMPPLDLEKTGSRAKTFMDILHLTRLSIGMKKTLALLMLLVVGGLVTSVFRNVIGLQTFGTFTPALLALSFVYKNIQVGLLLFLLVMLIGLVGRFFLDRLRLLMVPRLGAILTLVVLSMVVCVSALEYYGITPSAQAVLFPTVIFSVLIERFYLRWEEKGFLFSLKVLGGTCLSAGICLGLFKIQMLEDALLAYPEMLLLLFASFIIVGRYSGYRLTELHRFRNFTGEGDAN